MKKNISFHLKNILPAKDITFLAVLLGLYLPLWLSALTGFFICVTGLLMMKTDKSIKLIIARNVILHEKGFP